MGFFKSKSKPVPPPPPEPVVQEPATGMVEEEKRKVQSKKGRASTIRTGPYGILGGAKETIK